MVEHIFPYVEKSSDLTDVEMVDNGFDSGRHSDGFSY